MSNRANIIKYNKYIKNTLLDLTNMIEYSFSETQINNYKEYSLINFDDLGTKEVTIINLPNFINTKIDDEIGNLKDFFSFQNNAYILNYSGEKNTVAIRGSQIINNYNYYTDTTTNVFTNIIEGKEIANTNSNYNAITIDVDFNTNKLYTIEYDGLNNDIIYTDKTITILDENSTLEEKSKTYTIYPFSKGDSIPKYIINGGILSLPAGILFSSVDPNFNIRKKFNALEINSPNNINLNCATSITIDALDKIELKANNLYIDITNINIGVNEVLKITGDDISMKLSDSFGTLTEGNLKLGEETSTEGLFYITFDEI